MNEKDLKHFKEIIIKEKERLLKNLDALREATMETTKDASGEHSSYSFHMADQGTDSQEREKTFLFAHREERYLKYLEDALRRIERGEYGICENCKNPISFKRLEAVPIAKLCVECKNKLSK
ncbi:TraR/DksA family transcriptional regulator [candidate division KSB1 bacterium]|nr:MAG: TraR/DksA family transcriptional regulator [candidate division KSB1 bacterium]